jgi:PAT family beta-lactamase induction signal transducer AmpG
VQGANLEALVLAISFDNFAGSFSGTALIAYMSGLTAAGFSATQYALLSSLYALPGKVVGGISGFIVAAWGYTAFFAMTAMIALPVLALIYVVGRSPPGGLQPATAPSSAAETPRSTA